MTVKDLWNGVNWAGKAVLSYVVLALAALIISPFFTHDLIFGFKVFVFGMPFAIVVLFLIEFK